MEYLPRSLCIYYPSLTSANDVILLPEVDLMSTKRSGTKFSKAIEAHETR